MFSVDALESAAIVFAVAQTTYLKYWEKSGSREKVLTILAGKTEAKKRTK